MKEEYYNLNDESKESQNGTGTGGRGGDSTISSLS